MWWSPALLKKSQLYVRIYTLIEIILLVLRVWWRVSPSSFVVVSIDMCGVFSSIAIGKSTTVKLRLRLDTQQKAEKRGWTDGIKSHDVNLLLSCCCYLAWIFSHHFCYFFSLSRPRRLTISTVFSQLTTQKTKTSKKNKIILVCCVFVKSFVLPHQRQLAFNGDPYGGNISHGHKRNNMLWPITGHQTRVNLHTFLRIAYMSIWVYNKLNIRSESAWAQLLIISKS